MISLKEILLWYLGAVYGSVVETVDHLLIHYALANKSWSYVSSMFGVQWAMLMKVIDVHFGWRS